MKKFLAVIMSLVMMFSLAALPVAAADETAETEETTITLNDVFDTIEFSVEKLQDTINQIHFIVGTILGMLNKECPLCAEIHQVATEEEPESSETELPEEIEGLLA